jgi:hypothetical protein
MGKLVARLFSTAALWVRTNPDIPQKYKMGGTSTGVAKTPMTTKKMMSLFGS